ncbi:MAG: hypothetical protein ABIK62_01320, partial [candidate division WOR-3 bacterium]
MRYLWWLALFVAAASAGGLFGPWTALFDDSLPAVLWTRDLRLILSGLNWNATNNWVNGQLTAGIEVSGQDDRQNTVFTRGARATLSTSGHLSRLGSSGSGCFECSGRFAGRWYPLQLPFGEVEVAGSWAQSFLPIRLLKEVSKPQITLAGKLGLGRLRQVSDWVIAKRIEQLTMVGKLSAQELNSLMTLVQERAETRNRVRLVNEFLAPRLGQNLTLEQGLAVLDAMDQSLYPFVVGSEAGVSTTVTLIQSNSGPESLPARRTPLPIVVYAATYHPLGVHRVASAEWTLRRNGSIISAQIGGKLTSLMSQANRKSLVSVV